MLNPQLSTDETANFVFRKRWARSLSLENHKTRIRKHEFVTANVQELED